MTIKNMNKRYTREYDDYYTMVINDYHGEFIMPTHEHVHIKELWDNFHADEIVTSAMMMLAGKKRPWEPSPEEMIKIMRDVVYRPVNAYPECFDKIGGYDLGTLHCVEGRLNNLIEWVKLFAADVIKQTQDKYFGGDDTYYDYFPNYVNMLHQACQCLDQRELYNDTLDTLLGEEYHESNNSEGPGLLGTWYDEADQK